MAKITPSIFMFDLDNTLYKDTNNFFDKIKIKMNEYICDLIDVSAEEAAIIRDDYYHKYGTTLEGLRQKYNIDPDHFLKHIDDVCLNDLKPDLELVDLISKLPGQKYILTNASDYHAHRVLKRLELAEYFDGVFTIQSANHTPKPEMDYYTQFIKQYHIDPQHSIFFEDSSHNLLTAAELGIQTVLIRTNCHKAMQYHDHVAVHEVTDCLKLHLAQYT